jgi:hypothetical protein
VGAIRVQLVDPSPGWRRSVTRPVAASAESITTVPSAGAARWPSPKVTPVSSVTRSLAPGMCGWADIGKAREPVNRPPDSTRSSIRSALVAANSCRAGSKPWHQPQ